MWKDESIAPIGVERMRMRTARHRRLAPGSVSSGWDLLKKGETRW
jgi:hypothetical protein